MQIESNKIESMSEQINILNEAQKTIIFHENEIDMQREFIQMQNEIINDLVNEIRKLRGIPSQPRPPRSEAWMKILDENAKWWIGSEKEWAYQAKNGDWWIIKNE